MDDRFLLPVTYRGQDLLFSSQLLQLGYTHKFEVDVYGSVVLFEPDEEGTYRALVDSEEITKEISHELLEAIATGIETVLK